MVRWTLMSQDVAVGVAVAFLQRQQAQPEQLRELASQHAQEDGRREQDGDRLPSADCFPRSGTMGPRSSVMYWREG